MTRSYRSATRVLLATRRGAYGAAVAALPTAAAEPELARVLTQQVRVAAAASVFAAP
jgi:RNase P/RNase MRP subunit POP5